jgi:hypothetical protein
MDRVIEMIRTCAGNLRNNHGYPVAGLDPATHVFFRREAGSGKDVDARDKPGQGAFLVAMSVPNA